MARKDRVVGYDLYPCGKMAKNWLMRRHRKLHQHCWA